MTLRLTDEQTEALRARNKRLAWLATYVFLAKNGTLLDPDDDEAYEFVIAVASGAIDDVDRIAAVLASFAANPSS